MRLQRRHRIPRILEVNAPLLMERPTVRDPSTAERLQTEILQSADRLVVVSDWLARWAVDTVGCDVKRVRVIPNGCATPTANASRCLKDIVGTPSILIGFLGSMRSWHGIRAIPSILDALPEAAAVLIGSGPETSPHPRAHSLGFVDPEHLSSVLMAVDVAIAPYPMDAPPWLCPLKLLQYRAHGLPIVTADVADCAKLVSDQDTILTSQDPQVWATAIREQAGRKPKPTLRTWTQVCSEAIEGMLPFATHIASTGYTSTQ